MPTPTPSDRTTRLHADMDPLRAQLGLRPRRAPITPRPDAAPLEPPTPGPSAPSARASTEAPPRARATARPPLHDSGAGRATREVADATAAGLRALPQSPVAAAFGVAERLTNAGRAATRAPLQRSLPPARPRGPALFVAHAPRGARR